MEKKSIWRWLILIAVVSLSMVLLKDGVNLGLDLKGGSSWTVQIDRDEVVKIVNEANPDMSEAGKASAVRAMMKDASGRAMNILRNRVDPTSTREPIIFLGKDHRITIQLPGISKKERDRIEEYLTKPAFLEFSLVHEESRLLTSQLFSDGKVPEGFEITTVNGRQTYRIDKSSDIDRDSDEYKKALTRFGSPPNGHAFMLEKNEIDGKVIYDPYFVKIRYEMTGEYIDKADATVHPTEGPIISIQLDSEGTKKFRRVSSDYAKTPPGNKNPLGKDRQLAIILDGVIHSAPVLNTPIIDGSAMITGTFTLAEARQLAHILKAGALPAPIRIIEKKMVAPSLGKDSIESGVSAIMYGGIGILVFMLLYYMVCGVVADLALILNLAILPLGMVAAAGFLSLFAPDTAKGDPFSLPVLTLPGIAGILLTIGMAVDANVLIFERIREESGSGKRLWTSITAGYDRAFITILDANVTTLLTGVILFVFGSGPIRGFAVTLCAGIMVSLFTALVVTKLFFEVIALKTTIKSLKMLSIIKKTNIDFVAARKVAAVLSLLIIVGTASMTGMKMKENPRDVLGVDFMGGASLTFELSDEMSVKEYEEKYSVADIRDALTAAGLQELHIQYQESMDAGGKNYLQVKTTAGDLDSTDDEGVNKKIATGMVLRKTIQSTFPEAKFELAQEEEVGPQVGEELKVKEIQSIVIALVMIILYLSWRFEFGFAMGAIIALAHDVLVTVGIYTLLGHQISLPIVAALLTIVGYSVNDTIVVFDRIREDLRLMRSQSFIEICNTSINQTLSRTLLTSLTTLITVLMLLIFGGGAIHDFALALCIGVLVGTYSSIFVATPVVLAWYKGKKPEFGKDK